MKESAMRPSLFAAAAALLAATPALAQRSLDDVVVEVVEAAPGIHVLYGAGGNMALAHGADAVFLVDDQFAPLSDRIAAKVKALTGGSVRFLVNTHWHGDHTGGNEAFGKAGTLIFAHDNVRVRMSSEQRRDQRVTPPSPATALPVVTFDSRGSFHINGDTVRAVHVPHAHTDGDVLIYFEKADVLHMGDTFFDATARTFPFIDLASGGSAKGAIAAIDKGLSLAGPNTRVIPGHGKLTNRDGLVAYRALLADVVSKVESMLAAGKSKEAVVAAKPTAAYEAARGGGFVSGDAFVGTVYDSLKAGAPAHHAH
jgi:glyoxylase-like metal-dependent hydrolase (beta-lactamase superfamily II)